MNARRITYSVIMPVYNGRKYFSDALQSALIALDDGDEIVVIEDGSEDGGVGDIVAAANDPRIRYEHKSNGGVASALNHGLKIAQNPYFAWLSHDDLFLPDRLREDRKLRMLCPEIVTFSAFYLFNDSGGNLHLVNKLKFATSQHFSTRLLARRFLNGCTVSAPISTLIKCGMFDESLRHTQDYDMWLKVLERQKFTYIERPTVLSRQHPEQDSKKLPAAAKAEFREILRRHGGQVKVKTRLFFDLLLILRSK
jgi:glycosyltransferase involved in cell wall biosynthesis